MTQFQIIGLFKLCKRLKYSQKISQYMFNYNNNNFPIEIHMDLDAPICGYLEEAM